MCVWCTHRAHHSSDVPHVYGIASTKHLASSTSPIHRFLCMCSRSCSKRDLFDLLSIYTVPYTYTNIFICMQTMITIRLTRAHSYSHTYKNDTVCPHRSYAHDKWQIDNAKQQQFTNETMKQRSSAQRQLNANLTATHAKRHVYAALALRLVARRPHTECNTY